MTDELADPIEQLVACKLQAHHIIARPEGDFCWTCFYEELMTHPMRIGLRLPLSML